MKNILRKLLIFLVIGIVICGTNVSQAKEAQEQDQIILLNDTAAALEDTNPELSKKLSIYADQREKQWELESANKTPSSDSNKVIDKKDIQEHIDLLQAAAVEMKPLYPLMAKSLNQMIREMNRTLEDEK